MINLIILTSEGPRTPGFEPQLTNVKHMLDFKGAYFQKLSNNLSFISCVHTLEGSSADDPGKVLSTFYYFYKYISI